MSGLAESYTSIFEMEKLFQRQMKWLQETKNQQTEHQPRNHTNAKNCNRELLLQSDQSLKDLAEHPIAAFQFIKCNYLTQNDENSSVFDDSDLHGAALALARLQDMYQLNVEDIVKGKLLHFHINLTLTVDDCILIAQQAFYELQLDAAKLWLNECAEMLLGPHASTTSATISIHLIQEIEKSISWVKDLIKGTRPPEILQNVLKLFPGFSEAALSILTEEKAVSEVKKQLNENAKFLCQGFLPKSLQKSLLKCYRKREPQSYIPLLMESLLSDPFIIMYHQLLSTKEIKLLQKLAANKLETTKIHRSDNGQISTTTGRIGKMAWLSNYDHKIVRKIYRRVEAITGLDTRSAEDFQVLNYGIGGHYETHVDFFDANRKGIKFPTGDRIATFLFYLNDVRYGGATVFPEIGISVPPIMGSALMWYNLHPDGNGDYRTLHAACPVVMGSKWVANVWLHERGQEFRHPCK